jgi:hypothetical protein
VSSTATPSATASSTETSTHTVTSTPIGNPVVVIYPNPAAGPTVNVLPPVYTGFSNVRVEVFTLAFRKVGDKTFTNIPSGQAVTLTLIDRWGSPLANGVYYLVVTTSKGRFVGKLLIQR